MWRCPRCGSEEHDLFRFTLPDSLPMFIAAAMPKDIRSELGRLLEKYRSVEVYVCRSCGYAELRFMKR